MRIHLAAGKPQWFQKDSENAQAFYRLWPFAALPGVDVFEEPTVNLSTLHRADWLVLHCPMDTNILHYIDAAKKMGVKVWVDLDDLVMENSIPPGNPAAFYFRPESVQRTLRLCCEAADVISTSTPTIKAALWQWWNINEMKIHVIPNAIPDAIWRTRAIPDEQKRPAQIVWRGSITHEGDLALHAQSFQDFQNIEFAFYGYEPWMLYKRYGGNLSKVKLKDWTPGILRYFDALKEMRPDFGVVTLENVPFNHAKSNIALLEFTMAGAALIAPAYMAEFNQPGVITFGKTEAKMGQQYAHELTRIFKDIDAGKEMKQAAWEQACETIEEKYLLSITNRLRAQILGI